MQFFDHNFAAERANDNLIDGKRRKRIARGSGTTVQEVNQVLKQYADMRKMMKQYGSMAKMKMRGLGKLAVYLDWRRKAVKEAGDALADLAGLAAERGVTDLEGWFKTVMGTDLDAATASQMRTAAKTLREKAAA